MSSNQTPTNLITPATGNQIDEAQTAQSSTIYVKSNSATPEEVMNDMPKIDLVEYFKIRTALRLHDESLKNPTRHNQTL